MENISDTEAQWQFRVCNHVAEILIFVASSMLYTYITAKLSLKKKHIFLYAEAEWRA